jgi:hypothetical protein
LNCQARWCSEWADSSTLPLPSGGAWVFRDTRTPVSVVFDNLESRSLNRRDYGLVPLVA